MIYYQNFPETSGSLDSLPIRDNFDFLKVSLDTHASASANPHATTLQQVTDMGALTTDPITVTSSGSILKALRVQNNLLVGDNLEVKKNETVDGYLQALTSGSVLKSLRVQNNLQVGGSIIGITADTLDDVCNRGASTGHSITVTSSGSVFKSLRVQNSELVGDNLEVKGNILGDSSGSVLKSLRVQNNLLVGDEISQHGNNVYINKNGPDGDQYIWFYNLSSPTNAYIKFDDANNYFDFSHQIHGGSSIWAGTSLLAGSSVYINYGNANADAIIYFEKPTSGTEDCRWNHTTSQFEFSNKINVATSGSVFKSLRVQNSELVGDNLEVKGNETVDGYLQALTSGSVLKSLRVQNNLQVGGSIIGNITSTDTLDNVCSRGSSTSYAITDTASGSVFKSLRIQNSELIGDNLEVKGNLTVDGNLKAADWVELRPELAMLGDGTASNAAAQLALYTSVDADNPKCRHWTLRFDDTTQEFAYWQFRMPLDYSSGGRLKIQFYAETDQTHDNRQLGMQAAIQAVTPLDSTQMLDLDLTNEGGGWASGSYMLSYADPALKGTLCEMNLNMASNLNSVAAGDFVELGLRRDVAKGTLVGDCSIISLQLEYNY